MNRFEDETSVFMGNGSLNALSGQEDALNVC